MVYTIHTPGHSVDARGPDLANEHLAITSNLARRRGTPHAFLVFRPRSTREFHVSDFFGHVGAFIANNTGKRLRSQHTPQAMKMDRNSGFETMLLSLLFPTLQETMSNREIVILASTDVA